MKAIVLHAYGDVDQLFVEEMPVPTPGRGQVLVRIESAGITNVDTKLRKGWLAKVLPLELPAVLGWELAGVVEGRGEGATKFPIGARVMALGEHAYAEFAVVDEPLLASSPAALSGAEAAALPLGLLTGARLVEEGVRPMPGDTVLVTGALGNVGRVAVHAAKKAGARVIAGIRSDRRDDARELEVHAIVAIDVDEEVAVLPSLSAIADTVGAGALAKVVPRMKPGGTFATLVGAPRFGDRPDIEVKVIHGKADSSQLERLIGDVAQGSLRIPKPRTVTFAEVRDAHRLVEQGGAGKIVLVP